MSDPSLHYHGLQERHSVEHFVGLYDLEKARDSRLVSESCRLPFNAVEPVHFENDYFVGNVLLMHKPSDPAVPFAYDGYMSQKKRRWELRWQGQFKKPVPPGVLIGVEIDEAVKCSFATRAVAGLLLSIASRVSASKGSKVHCNFLDQDSEEGAHFLVPLQSADSISVHEVDDPEIPDIRQHRALTSKVPMDHVFEINKVYTFCYFSMYCDFVTWDIRNVFGANGTKLSRLVGQQPIRIVIKDPKAGTYYFNLLLAHRSLSAHWATRLDGPRRSSSRRNLAEFVSVGSLGSMAFYSANSSFSACESADGHQVHHGYRQRPSRGSGGLYKGAKKVAASPFRLVWYMLQTTTSAMKHTCWGGCWQAMSKPVPVARARAPLMNQVAVV